jgi:hypothetical protein
MPSTTSLVEGTIVKRVEPTPPRVAITKSGAGTRQLRVRRVGKVVAKSTAPCPLCGDDATTEVAVGPVFVRVCGRCGNLPYHAMGLIDFIKGVFNK